MRAPYLHPEFGYFCPTSGFRRTVRLALAFSVLGVLAGAGGTALLIADHESGVDSVAMMAHADAHSAEHGTDGSATVKAEGSSVVAMPSEAAKPVVKASRMKLEVAKSEGAKSEAAKSDIAKPEARRSEPAKSEPAKPEPAKPEAMKMGAPGAKSDTRKADIAAIEAAKSETPKVDPTTPG